MNAPRLTNSALSPFGIEFRALRVRRKMRLLDVARTLGKTPSFISAIEVGRKSLPEDFIPSISSTLELSPAEVERLQRAADISKKLVTIEPESPEARILASRIARKINSLSLEKIKELLKYLEYSTRDEVERFRRDTFVAPKTRRNVQSIANHCRHSFRYTNDQKFHVVEFIEFDLACALPELVFEVMPDDEMETSVVGMARLSPPRIIIAESKYVEAINGGGEGRWIVAHELGHIWLGHGVNYRGPTDRKTRIPSRFSAEYQADEFAAELLMPTKECRKLDANQLAEQFGVTMRIARRKIELFDK